MTWRNNSQLEVRWFSLAGDRRPVTMRSAVQICDRREYSFWVSSLRYRFMLYPPSTASIPPFQDLHDAFAFKDVFDPSIDHGPVGWADLRDESAEFRAG